MAPIRWLVTMSPSCQICFERPSDTVYDIPGYSNFPVCQPCIDAWAFPVDLLVMNAVSFGDNWRRIPWLAEMIECTVTHLHLDRAKFDNLVELSLLELKYADATTF